MIGIPALIFLVVGIVILSICIYKKRKETRKGITIDPSFNMVAKMKSYGNKKVKQLRFKLKREGDIFEKKSEINETQKKIKAEKEPHIYLNPPKEIYKKCLKFEGSTCIIKKTLIDENSSMRNDGTKNKNE